jgi:Spy/CpxP family protein refolding chaperone
MRAFPGGHHNEQASFVVALLSMTIGMEAARRNGKAGSLVKHPRVEEQEALAQLEKVLAIEREIKRAQVTLLVRIKNKLTPEQQAKLVDVRSKSGNK